jgi:protein ImuB
MIEPARGLAALEASHALEEPSSDCALMMHVLRELIEQLARELLARDQGAVVLMCLLRCASGQVVPLRVGLVEPSACPERLLELVQLHMENVKLLGEVDRVAVRVAVVGRLGERQGELFADRWPTDPHQLALLVNRLSSRLGSERVLRAKVRASPVPERAVAWAAAMERRERESGRRGEWEGNRKSRSPPLPLSPSPPPPPRPLLLYPKPQATEVVCVAPDGPPQFVWRDSRREPIVSCVGPERIETLWWRGPSVRRDYYRVATASGSQLWMFRQLADGRWFVHGEFV